MASEMHPTRLSAVLWLLLIFGSIAVISWYAFSTINHVSTPTAQPAKQAEDSDPNTFSIDEQLDMLNQ